MSNLDKGEVIVITTTYKDNSGTVTDPSTPVTHVIKPPTGNNVEITATRDSEGVFESEFTPSESGRHYWSAYSSDVSIDQGSFIVNAVTAEKS
jgi:hypothetical protein